MKNGLNYVGVNVSPCYETVIDPVPTPPPPPAWEKWNIIYTYV